MEGMCPPGGQALPPKAYEALPCASPAGEGFRAQASESDTFPKSAMVVFVYQGL